MSVLLASPLIFPCCRIVVVSSQCFFSSNCLTVQNFAKTKEKFPHTLWKKITQDEYIYFIFFIYGRLQGVSGHVETFIS